MEVISSTDVLCLQAVACGAAAYLSNSLWQQYCQPVPEPLIPPKTRSKTTLTATKHAQTSRDINQVLERTGKQCVLFYGSQTGTAERLAYQFSKDATSRLGLGCMVADLDDYDYDDLLDLARDKVAIFFLATYGEGEPTDNAVSFNQFLSKHTTYKESSSTTLCYTGFGLGNSSYHHYNEMIKRLDRVLIQNTAQRVAYIGFGDDGKGTLEEDFMSWKDQTISQLAIHFGCLRQPFRYEPAFAVVSQATMPSRDAYLGEPNNRHLRDRVRGPFTLLNPYAAPIAAARQLCSAGPRTFLHIDLDLSESTLTYAAGDHLSIRPVNSDREVERFLRVFGLLACRQTEIEISAFDSSLKIPVPRFTTYEALARYYLDICGPVSRQLLTIIAHFAPSEAARHHLQCLGADADHFREHVTSRLLNLAQLLEFCEASTSWTDVPFSLLLESIPAMKPRYYSISSSPLVARKMVSITTVVESSRISPSLEEFKGVATNYLLALTAPLRQPDAVAPVTHHIEGPRNRYAAPTALVSIRRSNFKLPKKPATPIIMIGPGTGVAPFRGFVQTRLQQLKEGKAVGRTMLFFGCRREDEDFLYKDEWEHFATALTPEIFSMHVAFSREPGKPKTYVQHLFQDHAAELSRLILHENACVYVCGDAQRMARDVFTTMASVLAGDVCFEGSSERALSFLHTMKAGATWSEDVW